MLDFSENTEAHSLLIVDDDEPFRNRLARAMEKRGFAVTTAASVSEGCDVARRDKPTYAALDLRLEDGSGLEIVKELQDSQPEARIVVLTGYGNIATAVAAVKAGAIDYLPKPADADAVAAALLERENPLPPPTRRIVFIRFNSSRTRIVKRATAPTAPTTGHSMSIFSIH